MTAIQFYHLTTTPLERALPRVLEKAYGAGFRVNLVVESDARADYINQLLWTYDQDSFLPHGTAKDSSPEHQPIFIGTNLDAPNNANVLFVTEGSVPTDVKPYARVLDMFDGASAEAVEKARARWKAYKDSGAELSYFKQNDKGGWEKAA